MHPIFYVIWKHSVPLNQRFNGHIGLTEINFYERFKMTYIGNIITSEN